MYNETPIYFLMLITGFVVLLIISFICYVSKIYTVRFCGFDIIQTVVIAFAAIMFIMPVWTYYGTFNIKSPERHIALQQEGAINEIYNINAMLKAEFEKQIGEGGSFKLLNSRSSNFINIYLCSYKIGEDENSYIMEFNKNAFGKMSLEEIMPVSYDANISFSSNGIFGSYVFECINSDANQILHDVNGFDFEMEKREGLSINAKSSGFPWGIFFSIATTAFTYMISLITARSKQRKPQKIYKKWKVGQPMLEVVYIEKD